MVDLVVDPVVGGRAGATLRVREPQGHPARPGEVAAPRGHHGEATTAEVAVAAPHAVPDRGVGSEAHVGRPPGSPVAPTTGTPAAGVHPHQDRAALTGPGREPAEVGRSGTARRAAEDHVERVEERRGDRRPRPGPRLHRRDPLQGHTCLGGGGPAEGRQPHARGPRPGAGGPGQQGQGQRHGARAVRHPHRTPPHQPTRRQQRFERGEDRQGALVGRGDRSDGIDQTAEHRRAVLRPDASGARGGSGSTPGSALGGGRSGGHPASIEHLFDPAQEPDRRPQPASASSPVAKSSGEGTGTPGR